MKETSQPILTTLLGLCFATSIITLGVLVKKERDNDKPKDTSQKFRGL
jgi:hypothetical protein